MFRSIQMLRALAVWLVVLHHVKQIVFSDHFSNSFMDKLAHKGAAGVDLFFIISGFIIYQSIYTKRISAAQFALNRVMRIVPAYWLFTGIVAFLAIYFNGLMFATTTNPELLIRSLLFLPTERSDIMGYIPFLTVGWTLNYEMFFYLLACLVILISRERFIVLISLVIIFSYEYLKPSLSAMPFYSNGIMLEFLLGIFIADFHKNGMLEKINPVILISLSVAAMVFIYNRPEDHDILYIGVPCAVVVACFVGLESSLKDNKITKALIKLGDYSYSTYLCHVIVICSLLYAFKGVHNQEYIVSVLCVPLTLAVSFLSYKFIERPIGSLSKHMLKKPSPVIA
ncbi:MULTISPECIES: acyltransferase family protein [unclassified Enterobacter]|uniref:acyltransferase family protein n=1 Tax=unclassified Enterobacter TaxID=2608935 RepID=UPI0008ED7EF3|nr:MULTISPECIES: acyltransferase [unclassified Enterobacter]SFR18808.1 Peptidoglycan/LPS O-acetylase OafA/YrhL, contains acyltransferase and SGNH-hydrolase domains [Enterobacter sp. kpr-6]